MVLFFLFTLGLVCWFFSTVAAGGAATILIPIITLFLGAQMVAPIISVAAIIANPTRVYAFRKFIDWKVIFYLLPGSIIGAVLGSWSFSRADTQTIQIILGLFLMSFAIENKLKTTKNIIEMKLKWFFPLGLIVSFLSGLIGATGPIHNPFMINYGITKEYLIGTKAVNSLSMQITKLIAYGFFGILTIEILGYGIMIGIGAVIGIYLAKNHLQKIDINQFRYYTTSIMFFCGVIMLVKSVT